MSQILLCNLDVVFQLGYVTCSVSFMLVRKKREGIEQMGVSYMLFFWLFGELLAKSGFYKPLNGLSSYFQGMFPQTPSCAYSIIFPMCLSVCLKIGYRLVCLSKKAITK